MHGAVIDSKANHRCCTAVVVKFQCRLAGNWNLNQHRLQATLISLFRRNRNGSAGVIFKVQYGSCNLKIIAVECQIEH